MTEEFNLSEKMRYRNTTGDAKKMYGWFKEEDVKEFIKKLKEIVDKNYEFGTENTLMKN